jgi:DNA-binding transcriptional LysR family regulator
MNYSLDQLLALEAIDKYGSFSAAGYTLHRATSAISYNIKSLEEALDVKIFDRKGRRAVLTSAGELILAEARIVLKQARRFEEIARELHAGHEANILMIIDGALAMRPMMDAVKQFIMAQLPTRMKFSISYLSKVHERGIAENAEIMLTFDFQGHPNFSAHLLPPITSVLVAHVDHPLNQYDKVNRAMLSDYVELVVAGSTNDPLSSSHLLYFGNPHLFEVTDFTLKRQALISGVGYGWLPLHLAEADMDQQILAVIPFEEGAHRQLNPQLVYRTDPPLGPAGRHLKELLISSMVTAE